MIKLLARPLVSTQQELQLQQKTKKQLVHESINSQLQGLGLGDGG
jgi:hypothetical protein